MNEPEETDVYERDTGNAPLEHAALAKPPQQIGRYRVQEILGEGGFGVVYLAHDDQLNRPVAIKVPHPYRVSTREDAEAYLTEARTVANLDHANIVPVLDVGHSDQFPCFVVSKFIDGTDLFKRLKQSRLSLHEAALLVATVAEALHHAHKQGLVHRDIKPGNILLDRSGKPFVTDFGLALREQDVGKGPRYAGTPAYMSPEQARGEGHRVDGRSDVFSLGTVFYQLLAGRQPFRAESKAELMEQVANYEPRPLRQIDETIPKELERICFKALSKRVADRYMTAKDMAEDLRQFLADQTINQPSSTSIKAAGSPSVPPDVRSLSSLVASSTSGTLSTPISVSQTIKIVPKGLLSFDAHDADFFLELLPGPRDREGLPDSIRFWKSRIETRDEGRGTKDEKNPSNSSSLTPRPSSLTPPFSVGLIYGPSGCGKSSLLKAGILPRLSKNVRAVYVEATFQDTETRLLKALRRQVPDLPTDLGLIESLTALRRGRFLEPGQKMLLVLDHFEQWLHAKRNEESTELVHALRQCNGERLQSVVMVRDDFWLAVSRFMQSLEIRVLEGENARLVDLFDLRHARKVLTLFGKAFGALPDQGHPTKDQVAFLDRALAGLAQEGKVISVRLALFAEMMKSKPWTPATLKEVGGIAGVGATFLEETFTASTAPPQYRFHQKAAQAVLKALLPEAETDIKGHMRSYADLQEASGYTSRPRDFDDLIRILDSEIRLITPTDPGGVAGGEGQVEGEAHESAKLPAAGGMPIRHGVGGELLSDDENVRQGGLNPSSPSTPHSPPTTHHAPPTTLHPPPSTRFYQLTHDYLVPSLRDWLSRKQKETRVGRAALLLADHAAAWNARPEKRQLPSLFRWLNIRTLTRQKHWTPAARKMMARAGRYHAQRGLMVIVLLALSAWGCYEGLGTFKAYALRDQLLSAETKNVLSLVAEMQPYRRWIDPLLRDAYQTAEARNEPRRQLHASMALLPVDPDQKNYLYKRLLEAAPQDVGVLRDSLAAHQMDLRDKLWAIVEQPAHDKEGQRLRAACALAKYDPESKRWAKVKDQVVSCFVSVQPLYLERWMEALWPIRVALLDSLSIVDRDRDAKRDPSERYVATNILAEYAADKPHLLANLLLDGDEKQFHYLYPSLSEHGAVALGLLRDELDKPLASANAKEKLAQRQVNAAVAMLRMGRPAAVWPMLKHSADPGVRSYLIHRLAPLGADPRDISKQLPAEANVEIRRALILSLGEFTEAQLPPSERSPLIEPLCAAYEKDSDAGLHAAAEWLLRKWGQETWLKQVNDEWAKGKVARGARRVAGKNKWAPATNHAAPGWYVNGAGQTMVVIPGPAEFMMGAPPGEAGRLSWESQHLVRINRTFAIGAKAVTVGEFRRLHKDHPLTELIGPGLEYPAAWVSWYEAAAYCNWLNKEMGIDPDQWCYETDAQGQVTRLRKNYLSLTGYRLPTEAEMEFAIRAGAATSRFFGESEELLVKYAWFVPNSGGRVGPVGRLNPNDFGLFDMHGNLWCWCQEEASDYPRGDNGQVVEDKEFALPINPQQRRVLRGNCYTDHALGVRSASRWNDVPDHKTNIIGFRLARTITTE